MPDKRNEVYSTTTFRYIESKNPLVPDSCLFIQGNKRYEVIFDEDSGWHKSIKNSHYPADEDILLGRIIGQSKIFRIIQGTKTIEWVYKNIPYENIIL